MTRALRALPTQIRIYFASALAYRSEFFVWLLTTNTPIIMMVLWRAVASEGAVGRFGPTEFTAYFMTTLLVRLLTGAWVVWQMNMEIRSGELSARLMKPVHPFVSFAAENLGAWPVRCFFCLPIAVITFLWVGPANFSPHLSQWLLFPVSLAGAWALNFSVMLAIGCLGLFFNGSMTLFHIWLALYTVFSGYIVPLELFPPKLFAVVNVLPFRYVLAFPVENLLGIHTPYHSLILLLKQWAYIAAFLGAASLIWRYGIRRYEAVGS